MKTKRAKLKQQHELAVSSEFVSYLRELGHQVGDPRPGVIQGKREPDAVCESPDGPIGIEVADAYHDEKIAKGLWDIVRGESSSYRCGFVDAHLDLAEAINRTLADHNGKPYSTAKTYILINAKHSPMVEADDAHDVLPHIHIPEGCQFVGIYLRLRDNLTGARVFIEVRKHG